MDDRGFLEYCENAKVNKSFFVMSLDDLEKLFSLAGYDRDELSTVVNMPKRDDRTMVDAVVLMVDAVVLKDIIEQARVTIEYRESNTFQVGKCYKYNNEMIRIVGEAYDSVHQGKCLVCEIAGGERNHFEAVGMDKESRSGWDEISEEDFLGEEE